MLSDSRRMQNQRAEIRGECRPIWPRSPPYAEGYGSGRQDLLATVRRQLPWPTNRNINVEMWSGPRNQIIKMGIHSYATSSFLRSSRSLTTAPSSSGIKRGNLLWHCHSCAVTTTHGVRSCMSLATAQRRGAHDGPRAEYWNDYISQWCLLSARAELSRPTISAPMRGSISIGLNESRVRLMPTIRQLYRDRFGKPELSDRRHP